MIHRAHDYRDLIRRWRGVARRAGLRLAPFASAGEFELFVVKSEALPPDTGVYISAGIHGDEAATTEGLLTWAEKRGRDLARLPVLVFPCLNPWGLTRNMRVNEDGIDLNRAFDRDDVPVIRAMRKILAGRSFSVAIQLHEDYDAQGIYLYEVQRDQPYCGEMILDAAKHIIPIDPRLKIDGTRSHNGVIRRRFNAQRYERLGGLPEAVYLHEHHARHSITFETPSEYGLELRTAAHVAVLDAIVERAKN